MKKQVLATLGIAILGFSSYATTYMHVKTKNGETTKFDVENVKEVVFKNANPGDVTPVSNHEYVDLGLPSGTLWATYNVGATKPEEYGDYFAWGETEPKEDYWSGTYKWRSSVNSKYDSVDLLEKLLPEDDAATVNWGDEWRTPTRDELLELREYCEFKWEEINGVSGTKFTAPNGKSIFFPAAGIRYETRILSEGSSGCYWASTLNLNYDNYASRLYINAASVYMGSKDVYEGCPVRPVRVKETDNIVEPADTTSNVDTTSFTPTFVDLNLPSGTQWAVCNIGATKEEEYGDYFAWGETEPKRAYSFRTYKWGENEFKRYTGSDSLLVLLPEDDAATANWGDEWRMPTVEEQEELISKLKFTWTEINGVAGAKFTSSNGNYIFFPAAGQYGGQYLNYNGYICSYWSSTLDDDQTGYAKYMEMASYEENAYTSKDNRSYGFSVRAVRVKK